MAKRVKISPHRMRPIRAGIGGNVQATILELVATQNTVDQLLYAFEIMPGELFDELQPLLPSLEALHDTTARTLRALLPTSPPEFAGDEPRVLELLASVGLTGEELVDVETRLRRGALSYGALHVDTDPRDWRRERREELLDALVYDAIVALRDGRGAVDVGDLLSALRREPDA